MTMCQQGIRPAKRRLKQAGPDLLHRSAYMSSLAPKVGLQERELMSSDDECYG